jgi:hypothetical protein
MLGFRIRIIWLQLSLQVLFQWIKLDLKKSQPLFVFMCDIFTNIELITLNTISRVTLWPRRFRAITSLAIPQQQTIEKRNRSLLKHTHPKRVENYAINPSRPFNTKNLTECRLSCSDVAKICMNGMSFPCFHCPDVQWVHCITKHIFIIWSDREILFQDIHQESCRIPGGFCPASFSPEYITPKWMRHHCLTWRQPIRGVLI